MKVLPYLDGEPTAEWNIKDVIRLCKLFNETYPEKNIWLWSGRTIEEICLIQYGDILLHYIDVLVDGPFIEELKDLSLKWRGSSNQRIWKKIGDIWMRED